MAPKDDTAMTIRLPKDLKDKLEAIAKNEERSINKQLTIIVRKALEEDGN